jgi:hypothetical protein
MGAIGVNGAAADVDDPVSAPVSANAGWARWTPFNAVAIGAHLVGGAQLLKANKGRVATQQGVLANTNLKMALTAGRPRRHRVRPRARQEDAEGRRRPGRRWHQRHGVHARRRSPRRRSSSARCSGPSPGLTGAMLASSSLHEEQQRPSQVVGGTIKGLPSFLGSAATGAASPPSTRCATSSRTPRHVERPPLLGAGAVGVCGAS